MNPTIPPTPGRFFASVGTPRASEPGVEMWSGKWTPALDICAFAFRRRCASTSLKQKTAKRGGWERRRHLRNSTTGWCLDPERLVDITDCVDSLGRLVWQAPVGDWTILRMGYTSTGAIRPTLARVVRDWSADKFNPDAVRLQFDSWVGDFSANWDRRELPALSRCSMSTVGSAGARTGRPYSGRNLQPDGVMIW